MPLKSVMWCLIALTLCTGSGWTAHRIALARALSGEHDIAAQRAARYAVELQLGMARYASLPDVIAQDPAVQVAAINPRRASAALRATGYLDRLVAAGALSAAWLLANDGRPIATSHWQADSPFGGNDDARRQWFRDLVATRPDRSRGIDLANREVGYFLTAPVITESGRRGTLAIEVKMRGADPLFRDREAMTAVADSHGLVFLSSVPGWLRKPIASPDVDGLTPSPLSLYGLPKKTSSPSGHGRVPGEATGPAAGHAAFEHVTAASAHLSDLGWTVTVFRDVGPAEKRASVVGVLVGGICAVILALAGDARLRKSQLKSAAGSRFDLWRVERRLKAVTDGLVAMVAFVDANETYQFVNRAYAAMFDRSAEEIEGLSVRAVVGEAQYAAMQPPIQRALRGETVSYERNSVRSGRACRLSVVYSPEWDRDETKVIGIHALLTDVTDHELHVLRLEEMSRVDHLTQVWNRSGFDDKIAHAISTVQRADATAGLLLIDLDDFKPVNDRFGHIVGDGLLKAFAQRLSGCVRSSDIVARFGGDEFAVILIDVPGLQAAQAVGDAIVKATCEPFQIGDSCVTVSSSIGGILFEASDSTASDLCVTADRLLYEAKRSGKGRVLIERMPAKPPRVDSDGINRVAQDAYV